jgi:hypothetical protein
MLAPPRAFPQPDPRPAFEAGLHFGIAIDEFVAPDLKQYLNPEAAVARRARPAGGFLFEYRLSPSYLPSQLWLYGKAIHGVRTATVDCVAAASSPLCKTFAEQIAAFATRPASTIVAVLRSATSLEAHSGLRYEFLTLNPDSSPAKAFCKAQVGVLAVRGRPELLALYQTGCGLLVPHGGFAGSLFEVAYHRNDAFAFDSRRRLFVSAVLKRRVAGPLRWTSEISLDTDAGPNADSIQTTIGLELAFHK